MKTASRERCREIIAQLERHQVREDARRERLRGIGWRDAKEAKPSGEVSQAH